MDIYNSINFNDLRIKRRIKQIESNLFVVFYQKNKSIKLHNNKIREIFGNQSNDLSKLLREFILITDRDPRKNYIVGKQSRSYFINWNNLAHFLFKAKIITEQYDVIGKYQDNKFEAALISIEDFKKNNTAKELFDLRHLIEINNQPIEYFDDKENFRLYAPFQNCSKKVRAKVYQNWFDYDINASAYTLLHQHYINIVKPWWYSASWRNNSELELKVMPLIYQHKTLIRNQLSNDLGISHKLVKEMLQTIIFNANLYDNPFSAFNDTLTENNIDTISFYSKVDNNIFIQELIKEIRFIWPRIMTYWNNKNDKIGKKIYRNKNDKNTRYSPTKFRAAIYFNLEREVLNHVIDYLKITNHNDLEIRLIHDGFFCKSQVNINELENYIENKTNMKINYAEKILCPH